LVSSTFVALHCSGLLLNFFNRFNWEWVSTEVWFYVGCISNDEEVTSVSSEELLLPGCKGPLVSLSLSMWHFLTQQTFSFRVRNNPKHYSCSPFVSE